jgi:hypothetical protein
MTEILASLENTAFATWLRESPSIWAYPTILTLHTLGLAVLVGANAAVDLRVLGFARGIPLGALAKAFPIMWTGFWLNALSGIVLFVPDATTKGTTAVFMWKLGLIAVGVALIFALKRKVYGAGAESPSVGGGARAIAAASLGVWLVAIAAGRWMAYV